MGGGQKKEWKWRKNEATKTATESSGCAERQKKENSLMKKNSKLALSIQYSRDDLF
jgi:hypothetical protein